MDNQNWWKENQLGSILTSLRGWEERGKQKQKQNLQIHCTSLCKGQTSPLATLTHQYILSTGGSAVSHNPAATSAKQTQEAPARLLHTLSLQNRGKTQAERCPASSHCNPTREQLLWVMIALSITQPPEHQGFQTACFMPGWSRIYTPTGHTTSYWKKKMGTHTCNNLTSGLTEGLAAQQGSVHSYRSNIYQGTDLAFICIQVLWSTSAWAACSHIPAWIWASGAAPASTAGIHPGRASPATSCCCSEEQQPLKRRKNSSLPPPFPRGIWTTLQQLEAVEPFNLVQRTLSVPRIPSRPELFP